MIPVLILVMAVAALVQFFVGYCQTLLLTYSKEDISEHARDIAGIPGEVPEAEAYYKLVRLLRVAPDSGDDRAEVAAVGVYFRLMRLSNWFLSFVSTRAADWAERQLSLCAYFAAVTLDRRLASLTR
jgi:hypothetical protein